MSSWFLMEGDVDVTHYPKWFFHNAIKVDFNGAIRATDVSKQNYSVVPRHWYIDAWFRCQKCHCEFCWTATEQQFWFEELHFYVESQPVLCKKCRGDEREIKRLNQLFDRQIAQVKLKTASIESKQELIDAINTIEQAMEKLLPTHLKEARELLTKQILRKTEP